METGPTQHFLKLRKQCSRRWTLVANSTNDPRDDKTLALLKEMIACLVDDLENVTIEASVRGGKVYVGVRASPRDVGFLVGKGGRMGNAIRTVLNGIGKQSCRSYLLYFESNVSSRFSSAFSERTDRD